MGTAITIPYSAAASTPIPNLLAGQGPEWFGDMGVLTMYGVSDLALNKDSHSLFLLRGGSPGQILVLPGSIIPITSTAGAIKTNESFIGQFPIPAGSRLVHAISPDATAGTHTGRFSYVVS